MGSPWFLAGNVDSWPGMAPRVKRVSRAPPWPVRAPLGHGRYAARAMDDAALLDTAEMARADAAAIAAGTSGAILMENAGAATAAAIAARWSPRPVTVLCGPGNNGGDGWVVARHLAGTGWPVTLASLVPRAALKGDAAHHAERWEGELVAFDVSALDGAALVVDALFGAGLARPLQGLARELVDAIRARALDCVAIDMPSGVDGNTGAVMGTAPWCALTVTFFRKKPGHLLLPGRARVGELHLVDIGIPDTVLDDIAPRTFENGPALWRHLLPRPGLEDHKYTRGHGVVFGGAEMTGAARLAARAALRAGAGLVTIAAAPEALAIYAATMPGVLTEPVADAPALAAALEDTRRNAILIGPGAGLGAETRALVLAALGAGRATVLDADVFTVFEGRADALLGAIAGPTLMTPHEGEYRRVFAHTGDKLSRTRAAAHDARAAVLLKGADTVIAAPDGRAAINANAPPTLATAGSGDVLAGFALALLAQGMAPFEAGSAAAWLHGEAAAAFGPGLVAEDLPDQLPGVLRRLAAGAANVVDRHQIRGAG